MSHPVCALPSTIKSQLLPLEVHTPEAASSETLRLESDGFLAGVGEAVAEGVEFSFWSESVLSCFWLSEEAVILEEVSSRTEKSAVDCLSVTPRTRHSAMAMSSRNGFVCFLRLGMPFPPNIC